MVRENNINEEVSKTLDSLNEVSAVKAKPYFYTRLIAKMESKQSQTAMIWKWSFAAMALVILINFISLLSLWSEPQETDDVIELMASEYSTTNIDIYTTTLE